MSGMCGWLGLNANHEEAQHVMGKMLHSIDGQNDPALRSVCDSHSGLAISSPLDHASLYEEGTLKVVLHGSVTWDDQALARIAREKSPAAAAAKAYAQTGKNMLQGLHGAFALAIIDHTANIVLVAVDRIGIHTMCYAELTDAFIFGSSADSVVAHPALGREIAPQGIFNYLFFHMVPSPGTIYKGICKLLPGQYVLFQQGRLERDFYWQLDYQARQEPFARRAERFKSLLHSAVARSAADEHTGAFLSGGTDSSTVTGILTDVLHQPAQTFSIGFAAEGFDETEYARITAKHFGAQTHEYYVTPQDVVDAIPLIARAYDEPFGNASAVPTYYCAKLARAAGIRVMLAGDGGDEIFGGNVRYAKQKIFELYHLIPRALRRGMLEPLLFNLPGVQHVPPLRKLHSYISQANIPLPGRLETYNFLHHTPLSEIFSPDYLAQLDSQQPEALMRDAYQRTTSDSYINRMLHLDLKFTLADNDLRKVNRMCHLAGVAVRYPLLDEEMVAFSASLPESLKVNGVKLRYFFKQALKDFLPAQTLTKSKHGFGLPFGLWMQTHAPLRDLAYDSLTDFRSRGYVNSAYIDQLIAQHRSGHASYYGVMIWVLMMLEQWLKAHEGS